MSVLLSHHLRHLARQSVEHRSRGNRRLHAFTNAASLPLLLASFSAIPAPGFGDLGAALGAFLFSYLLFLDALATVLVAVLVAAASQVLPWGPGRGWLPPLLCLLGFAATAALALPGHVYWHDHAPFLGREPAREKVSQAIHVIFCGAVQFTLLWLMDTGWRPSLREGLRRAERELALRRRGRGWENWGKNIRCEPETVWVPETREDVCAIVKEARSSGRRVRVCGSGFTWSPAIPTDDFLIFTERMTGLEIDPERRLARCGPGLAVRDLNEALEREGLAMPWNVVLETVTVGGIVSIGTHGSGRDTATLGDLVEELEVVTGVGEVRVYTPSDGPELWAALRVGFGLFGVITRVTLRVVPAWRARVQDLSLPLTDAIPRAAELIASHQSVEFFLFPRADRVWMRLIDRSEAPISSAPRRSPLRLLRQFCEHRLIHSLGTWMDHSAPGLLGPWFRLMTRFLPYGDRVMGQADVTHYRQWVELVRCSCIEVGFKFDQATFEGVWRSTLEVIERFAAEDKFPMNLTLNVRFIGESDGLLSAAYGEGVTCYIEALCIERTRQWDDFVREVYPIWLSPPSAMPHWAKEIHEPRSTVTAVRARFAERFERFERALAGSGADPEGMFLNPFLEALLGKAKGRAGQ